VIVQALHAFLHAAPEAAPRDLPAEHIHANGDHARYSHPDMHAEEQTAGTISRALFAWGNLPNFDPLAMPASASNARSSASIAPELGPETSLLPAQLAAVLESQVQQSRARLKPPQWLESLAPSSTTPGMVPVDQQSTRTDLLVRRWLERWGRGSTDQQASKEDQGHE
jgi:hypothetical protein